MKSAKHDTTNHDSTYIAISKLSRSFVNGGSRLPPVKGEAAEPMFLPIIFSRSFSSLPPAGGGARHHPPQPRLRQQPQDHPAIGGTSARPGGLQHPPQEIHLGTLQVEPPFHPPQTNPLH